MIKSNNKKNNNDLMQQAQQLRMEIIESVKQNGGHLAGNLGVVELTIALHELFNFPIDKIIFDVGHQSYVHKILTGRNLKNLRQTDGISGFNDPNESIYDAFIAGHSGNSLSAGLGLCFARDLKGENFKVIIIIGDASITNGLALESLFSNKVKPENLIVILNDNDMSISENKSTLQKMKREEKEVLFTSCGFEYIDGGDGHNFENLFTILQKAKDNKKATFIHLKTVKGKGFDIAEDSPCCYHSLQKNLQPAENDFSVSMAKSIEKIAEENEDVVVITPAMQYGLALDDFFKKYPKRSIDVGICESHAFTMAAGMARGGLRPIVCTYSTFLQRAYDQLIHDICLQNLPVVICLDRAGFVGGDGKTHQGVFDIPAMRVIPNLQIYTPKDCREGEQMLQFALKQNCPVVLRYPNAKVVNFHHESSINTENLWEILYSGKSDICLLANGARAVTRAMQVKEKMPDITVINARTIKPLDEKLLKSIQNKRIFTVEEGYLSAGFGSSIAEFYCVNDIPVELDIIAMDEKFIDHGLIEEQAKIAKISTQDILDRIEKSR